jgi:transcriptional regulator with XRE-family HTH domain
VTSIVWAPTAENAQLIRTTVARNVRRDRSRSSLTQEALAYASGISRDTIARLEAAAREPRFSTLVPMTFVLGVALPILLRGLPGPKPRPEQIQTNESDWIPVEEAARAVRGAVAQNVRREREVVEMTQKALALVIGVSRDTVARVEAGEREPRIMTLVPITFALAVPLAVLLQGVPGPKGRPIASDGECCTPSVPRVCGVSAS